MKVFESHWNVRSNGLPWLNKDMSTWYKSRPGSFLFVLKTQFTQASRVSFFPHDAERRTYLIVPFSILCSTFHKTKMKDFPL